jgi:hypothetical protein
MSLGKLLQVNNTAWYIVVTFYQFTKPAYGQGIEFVLTFLHNVNFIIKLNKKNSFVDFSFLWFF